MFKPPRFDGENRRLEGGGGHKKFYGGDFVLNSKR